MHFAKKNHGAISGWDWMGWVSLGGVRYRVLKMMLQPPSCPRQCLRVSTASSNATMAQRIRYAEMEDVILFRQITKIVTEKIAAYADS